MIFNSNAYYFYEPHWLLLWSMSDIQEATWYTLVSPLTVTYETFVFQKFLQAAIELL